MLLNARNIECDAIARGIKNSLTELMFSISTGYHFFQIVNFSLKWTIMLMLFEVTNYNHLGMYSDY